MGEVGREDGEEEEIRREDIKGIIKKLKEGKAAGLDGIPNEAWRYGGEEVKDWVWKFCNKVWRGEGWPEEWKERVVVPIIKKGKREVVEEYRGVTLMDSLYKVYAMVLAGMLREEVEWKGIVPDNQTGFRKGLGVMDNIYVINYLINRQVERKKGKLIAMFVDLEAAFDSVNREVLIRVMRERGIREGLVERIREMLEETKSRVKAGGELEECFWTARGVRQGCPLSPLLFNIVTADLEEEMKKIKWGE